MAERYSTLFKKPSSAYIALIASLVFAGNMVKLTADEEGQYSNTQTSQSKIKAEHLARQITKDALYMHYPSSVIKDSTSQFSQVGKQLLSYNTYSNGDGTTRSELNLTYCDRGNLEEIYASEHGVSSTFTLHQPQDPKNRYGEPFCKDGTVTYDELFLGEPEEYMKLYSIVDGYIEPDG